MKKIIITLSILFIVGFVGTIFYMQNQKEKIYSFPLTTPTEQNALRYIKMNPDVYEQELQKKETITFDAYALSASSSEDYLVEVLHEIPVLPFEKYNEVAFGDEKNGMIVGTGRKVRVTHNGGTSWNLYDFANSASDFYDVAVSGDTFFAVGYSPHIYSYTEQNGWSLFDIRNILFSQEKIKQAYDFAKGKTDIPLANIYPHLVSIDFYDQNHGVILGNYYYNDKSAQESIILVTIDGGVTWSAGEHPPEEMYQTFPVDETVREDFRDVVMKDKDIFVASTNLGNVYQYKSGMGWSSLSDNQFSTGYINSMAFADDQIGFKTVYTAGFNPKLTVLRTDDGGGTWNSIGMDSVGNPLGNANEIKIHDSKVYFVVTQDDNSPTFAYVYDIKTQEVRALFEDQDAIVNDYGHGAFGISILDDGTVFVMNTQKLYRVVGQ